MDIDKGTAQLLAQLNANKVDLHDVEITVEVSRQGAKAMFLGFESPTSEKCFVEDTHVDKGSHQIPIRIYRPKENMKNSPVVVFLHGGGWSLGDLDCYDGLVQTLAIQSEVIFVSVDYRLAPEFKFPCGLNDCIDVINWVRVHANSIGADSDNIAVMGDSAGGNLALVASEKIQSQQAFSLAALYLIYPVVDSFSAHSQYDSRQHFGNGDYLLTKEAITDTCNWYLDDKTSRGIPEVSPLFYEDLSHLPPTSLLLAGKDPLYDEGRVLADKLRAQGVLRRLQSYESSIHAFLSFGILPISQEARFTLAEQLKTDLRLKQ